MLVTLLAAVVVAACPQNAASRMHAPPSARQLITVEAPSTTTTHAALRTWTRTGGCWMPAAGPYRVRVGRKGLSSNRREGDGTTPTGTFRIGAQLYGNAPNPGVHLLYRRLRCGDWWNEDPSSPTYNSFQHVTCGQKPPFAGASEGMWQQPRAYPYLAVVEYNMRPVVAGRGSGIFLHAQTEGATNGCISLRREQLVAVLRWLRPESAPVIAIGTRTSLRG